MTAKPILTAQDFTEHFVQCWDDFVTDEILEDYPKSEPWTLRMLGTKHACSRKGAFLEKLCKKLNYRCNWEEPFRVDVSYVRKEGGFLLGDNEHYTPADYQYYYPTEYNVLIEHENGDNIHQELWKLLQINAPLKVLIAYDYPEETRQQNKTKAREIPDKMQELSKMIKRRQAFQALFAEYEKTEYLLIIGSRKRKNKVDGIDWRFFQSKQSTGWEFKPHPAK